MARPRNGSSRVAACIAACCDDTASETSRENGGCCWKAESKGHIGLCFRQGKAQAMKARAATGFTHQQRTTIRSDHVSMARCARTMARREPVVTEAEHGNGEKQRGRLGRATKPRHPCTAELLLTGAGTRVSSPVSAPQRREQRAGCLLIHASIAAVNADSRVRDCGDVGGGEGVTKEP